MKKTTASPLRPQIPSRARFCTQAQEPFVPGMEYHSLLEEGDEGWLRHDFCTACWRQDNRAKLSMAAAWKGKVPERMEGPDERSKAERILALLKEVVMLDSDKEQVRAMILVLYLIRRKVIVFRQEIVHQGIVYNLYEVMQTEELLHVRKVPLETSSFPGLQEEIVEQLK